ncbi:MULTISPECIES: hypothetical protein [Brochothrix]|uniref:DUF3221 domain-containing protein n=1 Tax=Brochothrix thermosphacta TaxID=2756 RepID=A0A1D2L0F4_BROTH|nr:MULTISPECIES: hypothetical protein [Brochothrix]SLN05695.1 hypothetical protein FM106_31485 [Brachybacterium faecium]ANZ94457.1 hypothetical protein BFC19_03125 [Brochothrix thermosphacta]ANZ97240.1 hypothetical protein BFC20_05645 [Brochothrix thermosphacta]ATF26676.1 hypothetical protein CNY62_09920 [Brochothrix thermosphacta]ATH86031.1 hypothetical protein CPF12_09590 [Brochothrix thermosphacta]
MKRFPIVTIVFVILIGAFFLFQQFSSKRVDLTFVMLVQEKDTTKQISGLIEGAGSEHFVFSVDKKTWDAIKIDRRYEVEVSYKEKHILSDKKRARLQGPFWSNESNGNILVNDVKIQKIALIK